MVAILLIGDEILSGSVQEVNLHPMLTTLGSIGYSVGEVRIVPDDRDGIAAAFNALRHRYEYVISAGGIGPTHDDMTIEAAVIASGLPGEVQQEMLSFLESRYGTPLTPMVQKMAFMPRNTRVIGCSSGNWPVIQWENLFILPGLPPALLNKMERLVEILPHRARVWSGELYLNADESLFADWLKTEEAVPGVTIGSYPVSGEYDYRSRLVVRGTDRETVALITARLQGYVAEKGWLIRMGEVAVR